MVRIYWHGARLGWGTMTERTTYRHAAHGPRLCPPGHRYSASAERGLVAADLPNVGQGGGFRVGGARLDPREPDRGSAFEPPAPKATRAERRRERSRRRAEKRANRMQAAQTRARREGGREAPIVTKRGAAS